MYKLIISWLIVGVFMLASCASKSHRAPEPTPSKVILIGLLTANQIFERLPVYRLGNDNYQPDEGSIKKLKLLTTDVEIFVFLGTWCSDSEREVPRFLKIMEQAKNSHLKFQLLGLDRSKRDADGQAEKYQIEYVPTFIVLHNDKELGRIVEAPMVGLEQDLLEIISSATE